MKELSNMELAYLAGVMDGDGSFSLCKKNTEKNPLYYPLIQLASTYKKLPYKFKGLFDGSIAIRKSYVGKDGSSRKQSYSWRIDKRTKCQPFLEKLSDYLIVKKDQAIVLINYLKNNQFVRGKRIDSDVILQRERIYIEMMRLNANNGVKSGPMPRRRMNSSDPIFWSYLAGIMDTDGSFSIKKQSNGYYSPVIALTMKNAQAIHYILKNCKQGSACVIKAKTASSGFCYRFGIYSVSDCVEFLKLVIPYMDIKKESASALLQFCELRSDKSSNIDNEYWHSKIIVLNMGSLNLL